LPAQAAVALSNGQRMPGRRPARKSCFLGETLEELS
jgi:hypothetical protein